MQAEANAPVEQSEVTDQGGTSQHKFDVASLFPSRGDPRRPPEWYGRALLYALLTVYLGLFVYSSWGKITYIVVDIVIALFLSLSVEPLVMRLIKHGWRRGAAAVVCLTSLILIVLVLLGLFGNMFVQQLISMTAGLPDLYDQLAQFIAQRTDFRLPEISNLGNEIIKNVQSSWVTDVAGQAVGTAMGVVGSILDITTSLMVAFYISIAGPRLRRSICQWIAPNSQRRFLMGWTVFQDQISGFLFSRSILAAINAACMSIFLMLIHVPYWLPLALFCGIVSQFVPTIGTYLGGALPVLFAWGERGWPYAIGVVVFITIYQQIENLLLAPKISERTMDLNPCIAFLAVLFFGSIFGALGAFLALPITASIQVLLKLALKRYPLVDMPLMNDPEPDSRSRMVEAADAINEHVIKPVSDRMPRQARGSSGHVSVDDQIEEWQHQVFGEHHHDTEHTVESNDESPTVAIPKHVLNQHAQPKGSGLGNLHGASSKTNDDGSTNEDATANVASDAKPHAKPSSTTTDSSSAASSDATDNPRSHWH